MNGVREVTRSMRAIFVIGGVFVLVAGIQLFVFSEHTDFWFAWTIEPPLTAAFLGSFYLGACVLALLSGRERAWDRARAGVPGVLAFVWITLAATLIHLDKFHLDDGRFVPTAAAWTWLTIYALEPPVLSVIYAFQLRRPGEDSPRLVAVPTPCRWGAVALGAILIAVGTVLFVSPGTSDQIWPWALTPLTARASAAWLVGQGLVLAVIARENDWVRSRWATLSTAVLAGLQAVALARYPGTFHWGSAPGVIYLAITVLLLAGSLYGWIAARRAGG